MLRVIGGHTDGHVDDSEWRAFSMWEQRTLDMLEVYGAAHEWSLEWR